MRDLMRACRRAALLLLVGAPAMAEYSARDPARVHMVTFRGCEEACTGFRDYFADRDLPVEVTVTDIARDRGRLPAIREALIAEAPDLVVTWGTSVSTGLMGTIADHGEGTALGDIPVLFMIVADPLNADLIAGPERSGRPTVAGVMNRVPEAAQMNIMFEYLRPERLGVLISTDEANSISNTAKVARLAGELGFDLTTATYTAGADGAPDPAEIPAKVAELAAAGVDALYVGSSSFNLAHAEAFTAAALAEGLPVFSAYEKMVTGADALMSVANSYANVGKLAATQAARILLEGERPGDLPIATLDRFSILINMRVARALDVYPPIQLIGIAEIVE